MSGLEALFLGLVQGLTEFLPVSSSGHLVMLESLLQVATDGVVFEVGVHAATAFAVLVVYRRRVAQLLSGLARREPEAVRYVAKLALATLPVVALVLVAGNAVEALFERPAITGASLLVTGGLVFSTRHIAPRARAAELSFAVALWIGCAQALALVPGISRSGSTVAVALALRVSPLAAAEFSFLLGVIAIAGAMARELLRMHGPTPELLSALAIGGTAAFAAAMLAIALFLRLLRVQRFHRFAYYTWAVGSLFLIWRWIGA